MFSSVTGHVTTNPSSTNRWANISSVFSVVLRCLACCFRSPKSSKWEERKKMYSSLRCPLVKRKNKQLQIFPQQSTTSTTRGNHLVPVSYLNPVGVHHTGPGACIWGRAGSGNDRVSVSTGVVIVVMTIEELSSVLARWGAGRGVCWCVCVFHLFMSPIYDRPHICGVTEWLSISSKKRRNTGEKESFRG